MSSVSLLARQPATLVSHATIESDIKRKWNRGPSATPEPLRVVTGSRRRLRSPDACIQAFNLPDPAGLTLGQFGCSLLSAILEGKAQLSDALRQAFDVSQLSQRGAAPLDLLPFPLPSFSPDEVAAAEKGLEPNDRGEAYDWHRKVWSTLCIHTLNNLYLGRHRRITLDTKSQWTTSEATAPQRKALKIMDSYIDYFLTSETFPKSNWAQDLRDVRTSYSGEEVKTAQMLTFGQVVDALPPAGSAARVKAVDIAEGPIRAMLLDPRKLLKPQNLWPQEQHTGKVFCERPEWLRIVRKCVQLGIFGLLRRDDIFAPKGVPVLNGAFGVSKGKAAKDGSGEVLRLIINLIPSNEYFETLEGDVRSLPYGGQWSGIMLLDDQTVAVFSDEDLTCAFYLFALPDAWMPYQALNMPVHGDEIADLRPEFKGIGTIFPAVRVIAMGWTSACGLLQYLHRRIVLSRQPSDGLLPPGQEVRKDKPVPTAASGFKADMSKDAFWSVYIDNYMETELLHIDALAHFKEPSAWQQAVRDAYLKHQVLRAPEKAASRVVKVERLGYHLDGAFGVASTPSAFDFKLASLTCWALRENRVPLRALQVLCGRWVRKLQMRRELSCVFRSIWLQMAREGRDRLSLMSQQELVEALTLLPLILTDFRLTISPLVTASDASNSGCGLVRATALTPRGQLALREFKFAAVSTGSDRVGLIEIFGGIGGGRRALELLNCEPGVHISIECDPVAARVVKQEWPGVFQHSEVEAIGIGHINDWIKAGPHIKVWLILAGFPCQGLTGIDADRRNLEDPRTQTYREIGRIREMLVAQSAARVFVCRENVADMLPEMQQFFSDEFGCRPYRACPSGRAHVRRPRLYWLDWKIDSTPDATVTTKPDYDRIDFIGSKTPSPTWVDEGWELYGGEANVLPTFLSCEPRSSPPHRPSGHDTVDEDARQRWREDAFRFPPYHYALHAGMLRANMWRYPTTDERELLLNFRAGHHTVLDSWRGGRECTGTSRHPHGSGREDIPLRCCRLPGGSPPVSVEGAR